MFDRRIALAGAALAVVGSALVGCSAPGAPSAPSAHRTAPSPTAAAAPEPVLNGVIATGTFTSADGRTTGEVVLTAAGNTVTAALQSFTTLAVGRLELQLSPHPVDATCAADSWSFVMNQDEGTPNTWTLPIAIPGGGPFDVDPTYLRTVIVRADADAGKPNVDGCVYPALAAARLDWNLAPSHTGLVVSDHGARDHATGAVTMADGRPSTYTVAPGDTLEAIESRFGITGDDFRYLNPFDSAVTTETLRYGTVVNLTPAHRGAPPR